MVAFNRSSNIDIKFLKFKKSSNLQESISSVVGLNPGTAGESEFRSYRIVTKSRKSWDTKSTRH